MWLINRNALYFLVRGHSSYRSLRSGLPAEDVSEDKRCYDGSV